MKLQDIQELDLEITSHCNIRCPQCSRTHPMGDLADFVDVEHWNLDKILPNLELEKMVNLRYVKIEGDNGDALMHPQIMRLLDHVLAIPSRPNVLILTNGGMRSEKWWRDFGERYQNRLRVQFSIDGMADTNGLYRVDINHAKVLRNAKAFLQGGGEATQRCIIFKHNEHQIQEIIQQARDIGMRGLIMVPNDRSRFQGMDSWAVYDRKFNITHHIENTTLKNIKYTVYDETKIRFERPKDASVPDEVCPNWSRGVLIITYKGHIIPCCMSHADLYFDHPKNDLFKQIVGDRTLCDVNLYSMSQILDPLTFYGTRLTDSLLRKQAPTTCQIFCPQVAGGKKIIPIKESV